MIFAICKVVHYVKMYLYATPNCIEIMARQRCVRLSFLLSRLDAWRAIWPFYGESVVYIVIY